MRDFCDEVDSKWTLLARDLCGTHVLRALLHALTGRVDASANRGTAVARKKNGKKKKKKRKKSTVSEHDEQYNRRSLADRIPEPEHSVPESWESAVVAIVTLMSSKTSKELYDMSFDSNGSPVLQLMLVIGAHHSEKTDSLIRRILDWSEREAYEKRVADARAAAAATVAAPAAPTPRSWVDDMVRDQCSSHVLEVMLQYSSDALYFDLLQRVFCGHITTFATAPICNFVVQKLVACARSPAHLEIILKEIKPVMAQLIHPRLLGVVWRVVEATNKYTGYQERVVRWLVRASKKKAGKDIVNALLWTPVAPTKEGEAGVAGGEDFEGGASSATAAAGVINGSSSSSSSSAGTTLVLSIAGARTLQQLFRAPPSVCAPVLSSFAAQTQEQLALLATHPVGSRAVLEAVLEGPDDFNRAKQGIVDGLAGKLVDVSCDRFGTYVVQKCYGMARMKRKEAMALELSKKTRVLSGSANGRHVLRACRAELYERSPEQWRASLRSADKRRQMFAEFGEDENASAGGKRKKRSAEGGSGSGDGDVSLEGAEKTKKKRKRKRKKK